MTEAEILKALVWCTDSIPPCHICKYDEDTYTSDECMGKLMKDALDLINRQKAEIEMLKKDKYIIKDGVLELVPRTDIEEIKSEARKEVVDVVRKLFINAPMQGGSFLIKYEDADSFLKEMDGEGNV